MIHIRRLASAVFLVLLSLSCSVSNSQDLTSGVIDATTGNLVGGTWNGATQINGPGGYSGGYMPGYVPTTGTIIMGYNQGTVSQSQSINQALAAAGTGIQVNGFMYSWQYFNEGLNRGTLNGQIELTAANGTAIQTYYYNMPKMPDGTGWVNQSGGTTFTNPYQVSQLGSLNVSFTGKDDRWWAGYYGPMIKDIDVRLRYGVDPCATNPAYGPQCAGFNSVIESVNLVPNPNSYAYAGYSIDNSYAINQALGAAGVGSMIHGFRWGYVANANGPYCNSWDMGWFGCWDIRFPTVNTNVSITNSAGANLYSVSRTYQNSYNTTNYQYLFPTSQPISSLGSFNFTATTNDQQAYIGSMWSKAIYTPDPCVINPLSSPTCPGYLKALGVNTGTTADTTTGVITNDTTQTATISTDPIISTNTTTSGIPTTTTNTTGSTSVATTSDGSTSSQPGTTTTQTTSTTSVTTTTASTSVTPSANNPQPKVGEITIAGSAPSASKSSSSGPSISQILNIVRAEQSRISAVETAVVTQAVSQAQTAGQSAVQQSESVAATAAAQSTSTGTTQSASYSGNQMQSQMGVMGSAGVGLSISSVYSMSGVGINVQRYQPVDTTSRVVESSYSLSLLQPASVVQQTQSQTFTTQSAFKQSNTDVEVRTEEKNYGKTTLENLVQQPTIVQLSTNIEERTETVKRNVPNNELAGGVDLTKMMIQPVGYNQYFVILPDVAFYAPKEIYKNQKTVDNVKVLRQLSSDAKHAEMVEMQYVK